MLAKAPTMKSALRRILLSSRSMTPKKARRLGACNLTTDSSTVVTNPARRSATRAVARTDSALASDCRLHRACQPK